MQKIVERKAERRREEENESNKKPKNLCVAEDFGLAANAEEEEAGKKMLIGRKFKGSKKTLRLGGRGRTASVSK